MNLVNEADNSNDTMSVAIIAIAKDEAAYLAEWIHHHAYFGFEGFFIGVNRTQDSSQEVIDCLSYKYSNIHSYKVDWMDKGSKDSKNTDIQSLTYAYLSHCAIAKNKYTHLIYLDIDEFWFYKDLKVNINDYLRSLGGFDAISFNWLMQYGDQNPFSRPFENLSGEPRKQIKSLINLGLYNHISNFRCHFPKVNLSRDDYIHIGADGNLFINGEHDQISKDVPSSTTNAFILHRAYRSEEEYVALLMRANPDDNVPIKNNRRGFKKGRGQRLNVERSVLEEYWKSLESTLNECTLNHIVDATREKILSQSKSILDIDTRTIIENAMEYNQALRGTQYYGDLYKKLRLSSEDVLEAALSAKLYGFIRNLEVYIKTFEGKDFDSLLLSKIPVKHKILENKNISAIFLRCAEFYERLQRYELAAQYISLSLISRPKDKSLSVKHEYLINLSRDSSV